MYMCIYNFYIDIYIYRYIERDMRVYIYKHTRVFGGI